MPNYRRAFVTGGSWFFTVNLLDRRARLLIEHYESLHAAIRETQQRFPFDIEAMVVLPDHLHAIWRLPDGDTDFPLRWRLIKIRFSKSIPNIEWRSANRQPRGERGIWQRRFWEHLIRDDRDLRHHIDYCWFNPVKHGHVTNIEDWPFSTFHRDVQGSPRPGDFEKALEAHTRASQAGGYSERE